MAGSGRAGYGCSDGLRHNFAAPRRRVNPVSHPSVPDAVADTHAHADTASDTTSHGHSQANAYRHTDADGTAHAGQSY